MENPDVRWKQRFQNYKKALTLLEKTALLLTEQPHDEVYQMAIIQAFEFCFELAWKTLKDYMTDEGLTHENTPKSVIKEAFALEIIQNGQEWIDLYKARNISSHEYSLEKIQLITHDMMNKYLSEFRSLRTFFNEKVGE